MVTVSHLVEKMVEKKPFLEEALTRGLINYVALANSIKPEIEKELKKSVKTSAVMMSLRRFSEKNKKTFLIKAPIKFDESDMTLKSGLCETTILKSPTSMNSVRKLYDVVDFEKGEFLTITHGIYEIMIIYNKKYQSKFESVLEDEKIVKTIKNLSSLTIKIPISATETVGMFYVATKAINWENINIIDIVSTLTEMTFILKEDDASRAFTVLKNLIESNKK